MSTDEALKQISELLRQADEMAGERLNELILAGEDGYMQDVLYSIKRHLAEAYLAICEAEFQELVLPAEKMPANFPGGTE